VSVGLALEETFADSRGLRAEQETSATPRTDSWQHWGVSRDDAQRGARFSMAAAEARAAKAANAKVVNCILTVLVGWLVGLEGGRFVV
jgi:hypothetical protein